MEKNILPFFCIIRFMLVCLTINVGLPLLSVSSIEIRQQAQEKSTNRRTKNRLEKLIASYKNIWELRRKKAAGIATPKELKKLERKMAKIKKGAVIVGVTLATIAALAFAKIKAAMPPAIDPTKNYISAAVMQDVNYNIDSIEQEVKTFFQGKMHPITFYKKFHISLLTYYVPFEDEEEKINMQNKNEDKNFLPTVLQKETFTLKPKEVMILGENQNFLAVAFHDDQNNIKKIIERLKKKLEKENVKVVFPYDTIIPHVSIGSMLKGFSQEKINELMKALNKKKGLLNNLIIEVDPDTINVKASKIIDAERSEKQYSWGNKMTNNSLYA